MKVLIWIACWIWDGVPFCTHKGYPFSNPPWGPGYACRGCTFKRKMKLRR